MSERTIERSNQRPSERSTNLASGRGSSWTSNATPGWRASDRAVERANNRSREKSGKRSIEPSIEVSERPIDQANHTIACAAEVVSYADYCVGQVFSRLVLVAYLHTQIHANKVVYLGISVPTRVNVCFVQLSSQIDTMHVT